MHANNETGVVFPIDKLSKIAKQENPDVIFHTDATQSIGKIQIDINKEYDNIDLLSMSGHKIYAPKGVGILFARTGSRLRKFITGGHHEFNKRAGTLNVPLIIGMAKAFQILEEELKDKKQEKLAALVARIEKEISQKIPYITINGKGAQRLSNTTNISFDCIEGESILFQLDKLGFCISSGSACTSGSLEPSHVLRAMQVPITSAHSSLRISLGRFTKEEEVEAFIDTLPTIISRLREISPFWDKKNNKPNDKAIQYSCQS
jgi:cysteine desulfurase